MGLVSDRIGPGPPAAARVDLPAIEFAEIVESDRAEGLSAINGVALAVVDLREPPTSGGPALGGVVIGSMPCVVIARTSARSNLWQRAFAGRCDAVLVEPGPFAAEGAFGVFADDAQADELFASVLANPLAAASLALLLRSQAARSIEDGLVSESTTYSLLQSGPEFQRWRASRLPRPARTQVDPSVRMTRDGDVLHLTLSRPYVHNAFDRSVRDGLTEGLELALSDPSIERVVLAGDGPSFSSGGDLDEFGSFADPVSSHLTRLTRSPARLVARLSAPRNRIEVRLHGACMGAGIELPAFATSISGDPATRLALPELRYGLIPGAGGTVSVTRRIGRHRSAYLGLSGRTIDAETALRWGLIDRIAPREAR